MSHTESDHILRVEIYLRALVDHRIDFFDLLIGHGNTAISPVGSTLSKPPACAMNENIATGFQTKGFGLGNVLRVRV